MSLSQKYSGMILVPWENVAEWRKVRELIYSDTLDSQKLGLQFLKMWKLRTPLLSSGVEGTLILLEARLENQENLNDYVKVQIYSAALLRFLNICAGNNRRQGTFYQTATQNDLPYWLITLRHQIAHDHRSPSFRMLECAISTCFSWVKKKYWLVQDLHMKDYVIEDSLNFTELIYDYAYLNISTFFGQDLEESVSKMKNKYKLNFDDQEDELSDFIFVLEDYVLDIVKDKIQDSSAHIVSTLVDKEFILSINYCLVKGVKRIPLNFIKIWFKIINLLYQTETLFLLINKLADVSESSSHHVSMKEIASLWIIEIYRKLLKAKIAGNISNQSADNNPVSQNAMIFNNPEKLPFNKSKLFQDRILQKPNEYTSNYLKLVLIFNGNSNEFIKEQCRNIKNLTHFSTEFYTDPVTIHTLKDVQELCMNDNVVEMNDDSQIVTSEEVTVKKAFIKLTDEEKYCFKGYPLGIMPPQFS